jgi:hypothetical protein
VGRLLIRPHKKKIPGIFFLCGAVSMAQKGVSDALFSRLSKQAPPVWHRACPQPILLRCPQVFFLAWTDPLSHNNTVESASKKKIPGIFFLGSLWAGR